MLKTQTTLKIFVASPDDIVDERKILEDVISEFNATWGDNQKVRIELIKWETHSRPGIGEDAQDVINQQIGDEYDIFMGIMWGRFGSPTSRAGSGTEEEFERAYARLAASPGSVQIMFYFKDDKIAPSKLDAEQLAKVQAFKRKFSPEFGGFYHEFVGAEEFRTKASMHLSKLIQDWRPTPAATTTTTTTPAPTPGPVDPLASLKAVYEDDDEDGLIELSERANDAMAAVADVITKMTEAITDVGKNTRQQTDELNKLMAGSAKPDIKAVKRISNNAANNLEVYVKRMSVEIPEFSEQHTVAMDAFGKIAMISATDLDEDPDDIRVALADIQKYRDGISTSSISLTEFRKTTAGLPRMTTAFNRARKRVAAVTDDLLIQFRSAVRQSKDVEELLKGMLESSNDSAQ